MCKYRLCENMTRFPTHARNAKDHLFSIMKKIQKSEILVGFASSEKNVPAPDVEISEDGCVIIQDDAKIIEPAIMNGRILLADHARVTGCFFTDFVKVLGNAVVGSKNGTVKTEENIIIRGKSVVVPEDDEELELNGDICISKNANILGHGKICGSAQIGDNASVKGLIHILGENVICGDTSLDGRVILIGSSIIKGPVKLKDLIIKGNAFIRNNNDYKLYSIKKCL